jgi:uncharacterized membrane protein
VIDREAVIVISAVFVLLGVLAFSQAFVPRTVEGFSEIAILGPNMTIGDYPKAVMTNETFRLYLYIGNHEGRSMYYVVYVKVGNRTTLVNDTTPADAPVLLTREFILADGENCTVPIDLSLPNPKTNARLIFEMWTLDDKTLEPKYHERWLQLCLNVTRRA